MTITQLEYILAVEKFRHFGKAAKASSVTQPTLSMQIQKLKRKKPLEWRVYFLDFITLCLYSLIFWPLFLVPFSEVVYCILFPKKKYRNELTI